MSTTSYYSSTISNELNQFLYLPFISIFLLVIYLIRILDKASTLVLESSYTNFYIKYLDYLPLPSTLGTLFFKSSDITEFLEVFEEICEDYTVNTDQ